LVGQRQGHPNAVFKLAPSDLEWMTTGAPVMDVATRTARRKVDPAKRYKYGSNSRPRLLG
jgi:hypothetical protein